MAGMEKGVVPVHLKSQFVYLDALTPASPPPPWRKTGAFAVGGLESVGFGNASDFLLIASSAGRGVIDCITGELVARDRDDFAFDVGTLICEGIGPLAGQAIRMSGLYGGGLPNSTSDGWSLERHPLSWPADEIFFCPPGQSMLWSPKGTMPMLTKLAGFVSELRAFGFAPTGRSWVLASSSDATVYTR